MVIMVGMNQVMDFQRNVVISQMIVLLHAVKDKTVETSLVMASGLVPRPIDHHETAKGIIIELDAHHLCLHKERARSGS